LNGPEEQRNYHEEGLVKSLEGPTIIEESRKSIYGVFQKKPKSTERDQKKRDICKKGKKKNGGDYRTASTPSVSKKTWLVRGREGKKGHSGHRSIGGKRRRERKNSPHRNRNRGRKNRSQKNKKTIASWNAQ